MPIDDLNQITHDGQVSLEYDLNGNLIKSSTGTYQYDALNRLVCHISPDNIKTTFNYDAFNRCISITENNSSKKLLYQKDFEIGSLKEGKLDELRIIDPHNKELVHALELQGKVFYPVQDHRHNLVSLLDENGKLRQSYKYSAFNLEAEADPTIFNPWKFANRRNVAGLVLFQHRFYNPTLMRWLTPDPIGFEDGLNLYTYVRNNPFKFRDPRGKAVFFIPLFVWGASNAGVVITITITAKELCVIAATALYAAAVVKGSYAVENKLNSLTNEDDYDEEKKKKRPSYDEYDEMQERIEKQESKGKKKDRHDERPNDCQNDQARDARREIEKELGRELRPDEHDKFHDRVTGQGYTFRELVEEGCGYFHDL